MKQLIGSLLLFAAALAAAPQRTFTGIISDSMCPDGDHSSMRMGPTNAECTRACVDVHGAQYVLYDGKHSYTLSDQKKPESFAGKKVTVTGTLDEKTKTIQVNSISQTQ